VIDLGGGATMEILAAGSGPRADTNGASIVARLTYGQTAYLFTGDATIKEEQYLEYTEPAKLRADVYKVAHHGSKESNDPAFITDIAPKISVISVGAGNSYGHPHQEVLDLLASAKSAIFRTDQLGTIEVDSNGTNVVTSVK
jgi:beta-lactamase superfamily II metal-dependent hydrolase